MTIDSERDDFDEVIAHANETIAQTKAFLEQRRRQRRLKRIGGSAIVVAAVVMGFFGDAARKAASRAPTEYVRASDMPPDLIDTERRMDAVAETILGKDVEVYCAHFPQPGKDEGISVMGKHLFEADGTEVFALERMHCERIQRVLDDTVGSPEVLTNDEKAHGLMAVADFSHEVAHGQGDQDEGQTNCRGVELYPQVAEELGIVPELIEINALKLFQSMSKPPEYHAAGC